MILRVAKISFSWLLIFCISAIAIFSINLPVQASELENQQYFIKHIQKDRVLAVSPNFQGELTQASLLPSLVEISNDYHIKATKSIQAEKLNGKIVPGLIVYVESKFPIAAKTMMANKP